MEERGKDMERVSFERDGDMSDIVRTVTHIFTHTDQQNWDELEKGFADRVVLDYTSMVGGEPATLSPRAIVNSWQALLPGFDATHHTISNVDASVHGDAATVFHYGTAWHYLPNASGRNGCTTRVRVM